MILFTWCYTFLGKPQDPPHLMLYLSGDHPGSSSLEAIPFWGTPRILLTWCYTFLGNPQDPPHLMLYLSGEPPGSSSLDAIPFLGTPRILLTWWYTFLWNPQDPPHLMIYLSGESPKIWGNSGGGDEIQIYAQTKTLLGELMVLIAVYCIFDLAYPNMYSQLLGICQEYILIQSSLIG
jgi:hypothetical protein